MRDRLKRILGASMLAGLLHSDAEMPVSPSERVGATVEKQSQNSKKDQSRRPSLLDSYHPRPHIESGNESSDENNDNTDDFSAVADEVCARFPDSKDVATVGFNSLESGDIYYARLGNEIVFSKMVDKNRKPYIIERIVSVREEEDGSLSIRSGASPDGEGRDPYVELNLPKDDNMGEMLGRVIAFQHEHDRVVRNELAREVVPDGMRHKANQLKALLAFCDRIVDGQPYIPLTPEKRKVIEDSITLYEQFAP